MTIIKGIAILIGVLLIAGCAVGWMMTNQALGDTESKLDDAQADVAGLEQELQSIQDSLAETQDELQDASASLSSTRNELADQVSETDKYKGLYEETRDELENTGNELESLAEDLETVELRNEYLEAGIVAIQEQLDLYVDTLGITVYSGVNPPYRSGDVLQLTLIDNDSARDPTWAELLVFLREDKTDKLLYKPGEFECGNFAQQLHDNAEAAGIRAAFVAIHFHDDLPHAVNAFKTVDRGLVYIDVTGDTQPNTIPYLDSEVTLAKDETMERSFIFPSYGWYWPPGEKIVASIEIYW